MTSSFADHAIWRAEDAARDEGYRSLDQELAQSPYVSHDATSWQSEQSVDTQPQALLHDDDMPHDMDRAAVSQLQTQSIETPTYQRAQRHKRARSR